MGKSVADSILERGFVEIPVDPKFLAPRFKDIQRGMEIITNDKCYAALFPWRFLDVDAYGKGYEQEVGLTKREDDESKWIFHYALDAHLEALLGFVQPPEVHAFFRALRALDKVGYHHAMLVAASIDEKNSKLGLYKGSLMQRMKHGRALTRILRYLPTRDGNSDAFPHIDRGLFTNHWGATHTGLYVYSSDGTRSRVEETSMNSVVFFTGRKIGAVCRGALGFGTPHGVRYDREADEDRVSCITFFHPSTDDGDAKWLKDHTAEIKALEQSLVL